MFGTAAEAGHMRKHGDRGRTAGGVGAGEVSRLVVLGQDPHGRSPLLHLRDDGQPRPAQRAREILGLVNVDRPFELFLCSERAPPLHVQPGVGHQAGQEIRSCHCWEILAQF